MFRLAIAALLGLAVPACSHREQAPAVQPGAPAGDVVEVSGTVTATGTTGTRTLKQGDSVAADEAIDTGAGSVAIVLRHNSARWELGPDHHGAKVGESAAWKLAKLDGVAKPVDQQTTPAGREAEHHAVDTVATTTGAATVTATPPVARTAVPEPAATTPAKVTPAPQRPTTAIKGTRSMPPPPNIQPGPGAVAAERTADDLGSTSRRKDNDGEVAKEDKPKADPPANTKDTPAQNHRGGANIRTQLSGDPALRACLKAKAHLVIACVAGTCTVTSADVTDAVHTCLVDRVNAMKLADVTLTIDLTK